MTEKFQQTVQKVVNLLADHKEDWESRYSQYAKKIQANLEEITKNKKKFHNWSPIRSYMNITKAKENMAISLRYKGQEIAELKVKKDEVKISTKNFDDENRKYFKCEIKLDNEDWTSKNATAFRNFFKKCKEKPKSSKPKSSERELEDLLKKGSSGIGIVKIADIYDFQFTTPLSASKGIGYRKKGGGIDILARDKSRNLCVMELKDENKPSEPVENVLKQAIAYAVFLRQLLRSKAGKDWYKLFGFNGKLPEKLKINVISVMPVGKESYISESLPIENDTLILKCWYFKEEGDKIKFSS